MSKSKIEWCDYTINPVKGKCPMACPYCYARRLYNRFRWNPEIRFEPLVLADPFCYSKPSKIFIGSTIELFGEWVKPAWLDMIFEFTQRETNKRHTFIFLTKKPENLIKWSPFPENCWIGVSVTLGQQLSPAIWKLSDIQCNKRFISFEPLLGNIRDIVLPAEWDDCIDWVIIGQQTPPSKKTEPKIEWVREIVEACDNAKIPVFLKNNLRPILPDKTRKEIWGQVVLKQEFPI